MPFPINQSISSVFSITIWTIDLLILCHINTPDLLLSTFLIGSVTSAQYQY